MNLPVSTCSAARATTKVMARIISGGGVQFGGTVYGLRYTVFTTRPWISHGQGELAASELVAVRVTLVGAILQRERAGTLVQRNARCSCIGDIEVLSDHLLDLSGISYSKYLLFWGPPPFLCSPLWWSLALCGTS